MSGDPALAALLDEVRAYPGLDDRRPLTTDPAAMLFVSMEFVTVDRTELSFFSTVATFGTALDVTLSELSIESFFPANDITREELDAARRRARS